jgi:hypothetical protein
VLPGVVGLIVVPPSVFLVRGYVTDSGLDQVFCGQCGAVVSCGNLSQGEDEASLGFVGVRVRELGVFEGSLRIGVGGMSARDEGLVSLTECLEAFVDLFASGLCCVTAFVVLSHVLSMGVIR